MKRPSTATPQQSICYVNGWKASTKNTSDNGRTRLHERAPAPGGGFSLWCGSNYTKFSSRMNFRNSRASSTPEALVTAARM